MPLLKVEQLHKHFGSHCVLRDISFELYRGEIVGLSGGSGSGKSTLARCISGLTAFDQGSIHLAGLPLASHRRAKDFKQQASLLQMVFQDPYTSVNPRWRIVDVLTEPLQNISRTEQQFIAAEWLVKVGLNETFLQRYPAELSGGQLQRVNIARALIKQPQLLICDESLAALDVSTQAQVANLLKDLRDQLGISILFIGHDLAMMNFLCDRIAVMHQGQLVEIAATAHILTNAQHPYAQKLVANARRKAEVLQSE